MAITSMRLNFTLLATAWAGSPSSSRALRAGTGYGKTQFEGDCAALERLMFVYFADRLRASVEDTLRIFIEDFPPRGRAVTPNDPDWTQAIINAENIRKAIERAGDKISRGSVFDLSKRMMTIFGVRLFRRSEQAFLNYVFESRNLLVHRGEKVDARFLERTFSRQTLGADIKLPKANALNKLVIQFPHALCMRLGEQVPKRAVRFSQEQNHA